MSSPSKRAFQRTGSYRKALGKSDASSSSTDDSANAPRPPRGPLPLDPEHRLTFSQLAEQAAANRPPSRSKSASKQGSVQNISQDTSAEQQPKTRPRSVSAQLSISQPNTSKVTPEYSPPKPSSSLNSPSTTKSGKKNILSLPALRASLSKFTPKPLFTRSLALRSGKQTSSSKTTPQETTPSQCSSQPSHSPSRSPSQPSSQPSSRPSSRHSSHSRAGSPRSPVSSRASSRSSTHSRPSSREGVRPDIRRRSSTPPIYRTYYTPRAHPTLLNPETSPTNSPKKSPGGAQPCETDDLPQVDPPRDLLERTSIVRVSQASHTVRSFSNQQGCDLQSKSLSSTPEPTESKIQPGNTDLSNSLARLPDQLLSSSESKPALSLGGSQDSIPSGIILQGLIAPGEARPIHALRECISSTLYHSEVHSVPGRAHPICELPESIVASLERQEAFDASEPPRSPSVDQPITSAPSHQVGSLVGQQLEPLLTEQEQSLSSCSLRDPLWPSAPDSPHDHSKTLSSRSSDPQVCCLQPRGHSTCLSATEHLTCCFARRTSPRSLQSRTLSPHDQSVLTGSASSPMLHSKTTPPHSGSVRSVSPHSGSVRSVSPHSGSVRSVSPHSGSARSISPRSASTRSSSPRPPSPSSYSLLSSQRVITEQPRIPLPVILEPGNSRPESKAASYEPVCSTSETPQPISDSSPVLAPDINVYFNLSDRKLKQELEGMRGGSQNVDGTSSISIGQHTPFYSHFLPSDYGSAPASFSGVSGALEDSSDVSGFHASSLEPNTEYSSKCSCCPNSCVCHNKPRDDSPGDSGDS